MLARTTGALGARVATLEAGVRAVEDELARTRRLIEGLKGNVRTASEHLPDRQGPGPIARARDALSGAE